MKILQIMILLTIAVATTNCERTTPPIIQIVEGAHVTDVPPGHIRVVGKTRSHNSVDLERDYEEEIKPGITLRTTARQTGYTSLYPDGVEFSDELRQSDGRTVDFDCDKVADKILDRDLVPPVQQQCRVLHEVGLEFFKTVVTEFVDDRGRTWQLKH